VADWIIFLRTDKNCSLSVWFDWQAEKLLSSPDIPEYRYIAIQNKIIPYRDIKVTYRYTVLIFFLDIY
jgi:hypothetical protein